MAVSKAQYFSYALILNAVLQVVSVTYNDLHSCLRLIHTFLIHDSFYVAIFLAVAQAVDVHTSSSSLQYSEIFSWETF